MLGGPLIRRRAVMGGALAGRLVAAGMTGRRLAPRNIEDVQSSAGGLLYGGLLAGVVRDVVPIDDVVVPVPLAGLEGAVLELEGALP